MSGIKYVVEWRGVVGNGAWRKVRGDEGGPWSTAIRAHRIAVARSAETGSAHRIQVRRFA